MTRILGHNMAPEVFGLWATELALCFIATWAVLGDGAVPPFGLGLAHHALAFALALSLPALALGLYRAEALQSSARLAYDMAITGLVALPLVLLIGMLLGGWLEPLSLLRHTAVVLLAWSALVPLTRLGFGAAVRQGIFRRRVVIAGAAPGSPAVTSILSVMRPGFVESGGLLGEADLPASAAALRQARIWAVVNASPNLPGIEDLARDGVRIFTDVQFREQQRRRIDVERLAPNWLDDARGYPQGPLQAAARRALDISASLGLLVLTLPLMLLTALAVWLDDPGPVLYRQERLGLNGQGFTLLKFRSMRVDAEAAGPVWASQKDPRVTRIGGFMRRTRIDELPQIFNVLRGQMSLVGPRPERPHFADQLAAAIPFYNERIKVKPGLTGWAQINFPYGASVEDARQKLSYDLYYVKNRSLTLDVLILLATVRVILFREGSR